MLFTSLFSTPESLVEGRVGSSGGSQKCGGRNVQYVQASGSSVPMVSFQLV